MDVYRFMFIFNVVHRIAQVLFAVVVLGCSAYVVDNTSSLAASTKGAAGFGVFTGLVGFLAGALFTLTTAKPALKSRMPSMLGGVEAVISGLCAIFFLATGAALAALGSCSAGTYCNTYNAVIVFSFLSFIVWTGSTVFVILEWQNVFPRPRSHVNAGPAHKVANAPSPSSHLQVHAQPTPSPAHHAPTGAANV